MSWTELLSPEVLARISDYSVLSRVAVEGFLSGLHRSVTRGSGGEFVQYRGYVPGDDLKHVDWKLYARLGRVYTKVYQEETNMRCAVVLDASASMAYQGGRAVCSKFHYGAMLSACLAYLGRRQGDQVGLFVYADRLLLGTSRGQRAPRLPELLADLAKVEVGGRANHDAAISTAEEFIGRRGLLVLLSDGHDLEHGLARLVRRIRFANRDGLVCQILDADELDLPFADLRRFVDSESGDEITTMPGLVRENYRRRMDRFVARQRDDCLRNGTDYELATTDQNLGDLLAAYLYRREAMV